MRRNVVDVMEAALHAGLLEDASTGAEERYRFTEQEVLYDEISARTLHLGQAGGSMLGQLVVLPWALAMRSCY